MKCPLELLKPLVLQSISGGLLLPSSSLKFGMTHVSDIILMI